MVVILVCSFKHTWLSCSVSFTLWIQYKVSGGGERNVWGASGKFGGGATAPLPRPRTAPGPAGIAVPQSMAMLYIFSFCCLIPSARSISVMKTSLIIWPVSVLLYCALHPDCQPQWKILRDQTRIGGQSPFEIDTVQECLDYCIETPDCFGVDVDVNDDPMECWPHNDSSHYRDSRLLIDKIGTNTYELVRCKTGQWTCGFHQQSDGIINTAWYDTKLFIVCTQRLTVLPVLPEIIGKKWQIWEILNS